MGYPFENFQEALDSEFTCAICLGVFEDPVQGRCGHAFCRSCITRWISPSKFECPLDKSRILPEDLVPVCVQLASFLKKQKLQCVNSGCSDIVLLGAMSTHRQECLQEQLMCPGCDEMLTRNSLRAHKCAWESDENDSVVEIARRHGPSVSVGVRVAVGQPDRSVAVSDQTGRFDQHRTRYIPLAAPAQTSNVLNRIFAHPHVSAQPVISTPSRPRVFNNIFSQPLPQPLPNTRRATGIEFAIRQLRRNQQ
jgi:hypothetical protein